MGKLLFYKLQASGNDFVLIESKAKKTSSYYKKLANKLCQSKIGIGADGLLVIEPSRKHDYKMRIFNRDGSEAEMCGNGARCCVLWSYFAKKKKRVSFDTAAGVINGEVVSASKSDLTGQVSVKMTDPVNMRQEMPLKVLDHKMHVQFLNTGVPHTVIFVQGLEKIDVYGIGRAIRCHKKFAPAGTNVNFVEVVNEGRINLRTYERGVEAETLACGTGTVASAILSRFKIGVVKPQNKVDVKTQSGEILRVYFCDNKGRVNDVWLQGKASIVFKGEVIVKN
jgi:diaminopimelate epimerase